MLPNKKKIPDGTKDDARKVVKTQQLFACMLMTMEHGIMELFYMDI